MSKTASAFAPEPKQHRITQEGYPFIGIGAAVTFLSLFLGWVFMAVFMAAITIFICFFFRNPKREVPRGTQSILAPADGRIVAIEEMADRTKISTFMSVFNCHVNRVPVTGTVESVSYEPGRFFVASLDKASKLNERNTIIMKDEAGRHISVVQIAGVVARRIVCYLKQGLEVGRGSRLGLIRFGSRVDLFLPRGSFELKVKKGDRVRAGESIIGSWL